MVKISLSSLVQELCSKCELKFDHQYGAVCGEDDENEDGEDVDDENLLNWTLQWDREHWNQEGEYCLVRSMANLMKYYGHDDTDQWMGRLMRRMLEHLCDVHQVNCDRYSLQREQRLYTVHQENHVHTDTVVLHKSEWDGANGETEMAERVRKMDPLQQPLRMEHLIELSHLAGESNTGHSSRHRENIGDNSHQAGRWMSMN